MIKKQAPVFNGKRSSADLVEGAISQNTVRLAVSQLYASDESTTGYFTPDEMEDYIATVKVNPHGLTYFDILFENFQLGNKITSPLLTKIDRGGNEYLWVQFSKGEPTKVILLHGMYQFIKDYQKGVIRPDFDGYAVIEELRRLQKN